MKIMGYKQAAALKAQLSPAPRSRHEREIRAECQRRRIDIYSHGIALRFIGAGVDLIAAGFYIVRLEDLIPARMSPGKGHAGIA